MGSTGSFEDARLPHISHSEPPKLGASSGKGEERCGDGQEGGRVVGELQAGEGAGARSAEGRRQRLQLEHPQHPGPMADSDLPGNQPSGLSLTSWLGYSGPARPPRRVHWPVSPGRTAQGWGGHSCGPAASLLLSPQGLPPPTYSEAEEQLAGGGRHQGSRGGGCWAPRSRAGEALCEEAAVTHVGTSSAEGRVATPQLCALKVTNPPISPSVPLHIKWP